MQLIFFVILMIAGLLSSMKGILDAIFDDYGKGTFYMSLAAAVYALAAVIK